MYARRSIAAPTAALLLACASPAIAAGEIPDLETDRPDQTETATVVPAGAIQFEGGVGYERKTAGTSFGNTARFTTVMMPTALVRYGLFPVAELRVGFDYGISRRHAPPNDPLLFTAVDHVDELLGAVSLGTKISLLDGAGGGPQAAVIADVELDPMSLDDPVPGLRLSLAQDLGGGLSLGTNVAGSWDGREEMVAWAYTGALGFDISESIGGFVELFGEMAPEMPPMHSLDAGVTLLRDANVQFDLAGGVGLNEQAPDYFIGVGVSFRMLPVGP